MLKRKEFILGALAGLTLAAGATAGGIVTWPGAHADPQAVNRITPVPANGDRFSPPPGAPNSFADIFDQVAPAVVQIDVTVKVDQPQGGAFQIPGLPFQFVPPQGRSDGEDAEPRTTQGAGSGFFISQDGFIVTNNHVVADATEIKVKMSDGRELPARLVGRDEATDLAVIKVDGDNFKYVSFEETAEPRVGDWVIAVGNPFGLGGTATAGIVSAKARSLPDASSAYTDFLQIDAAINRGNSGGPTFDVYGRVIGVNSVILSPTGSSVGIGFAIPAEIAKQITSRLMRGEVIERGYLGVKISTPTPEELGALGLKADQKGALVAEVTPEGPADKAGLRFSDLVVSLNGEVIDSSTKLTRLVGAAKPGDTLRMEVLRDGRRQTITARSGTRPSETELNSENGLGQGGAAPNDPSGASATVEGLNLTPLTPALRQRLGAPASVEGLAIMGVETGVDARLGQGVVVQQVQNTPVRTVDDFRNAVASVKASGRSGAYLLIWVRGQGNVPYVLTFKK